MTPDLKQPALIKDGSECIALFKSIDWSLHPLGPSENWPQSLRSTLSIIFYSKFPMFLWWGADLYCFYNDAYRPSLGNHGKHPAAMGEKGKVVWPEIWELIYPDIEQVMNGGDATWHQDRYIPIFRNNQMEDVYWTYSYSPVIGESSEVEGVFVTCNETTEKVLAEKHLLKLTSQLQVNEAALLKSNEALKQFAYIASHDLKEPLRMVISFMGLLKNKYAGQLDEKAHSYIDIAMDGGTRMQTMICDLLELSHTGQGGHKVLTSLQDIMKEVKQNIFKLIAENDAEIVVNTTLPDLPVFRGDISRLFQNLLSNAIKFRKKETTPTIQIDALEKEHEWLFSVKDNGIGIEKHNCAKIFEIFARLHSVNTFEGSGIGLAVCKKIVEYHGGTIWVDSTEGEGCTFYFTLLKR